MQSQAKLKLVYIDPFSVSKHCDIFLWAELRWRQKDSPDRFSDASYMKFVSLFLLTMTGENQILPTYIRSLTVQDHACYLNKLKGYSTQK